MKKLSILLFACGAAIIAIAWTNGNLHTTTNLDFTQNQGDNKVLMLTKSFNSSDINKVKVNTFTVSEGNIEVVGNADNQTTVEMYVQSNRNENLSKEKIQQLLNNYNIVIDVSKGILTVNANCKVENNTLSFSFKIHTAKKVSTDLITSGGDIMLASLHGNEVFTTSGGKLRIDDVSGNINGTASGGNIEANNCFGDIRMLTSGGNITVNNLNGNTKIATSGGIIEAQNISGGLQASTAGGSITAQFNKITDDIGLFTSGGNIAITIPQNAALLLDLKGSSIHHTNISLAPGYTTETPGETIVNGIINGGGATLKARASDGKIDLMTTPLSEKGVTEKKIKSN